MSFNKGFGVREINLIGAQGVPSIDSPNNLNLNAVNVAISTDVSIGGTCTATEFDGAISGWILGNDSSNHYTFTGPGLTGTVNDPDLNLVRGQKYIFHNRSSGHPFRIQSTPNGSAGTQYNTGVTMVLHQPILYLRFHRMHLIFYSINVLLIQIWVELFI